MQIMNAGEEFTDLRMVAAALPHVLLIMKNKGRKSIVKQKKPA
jgi:hypothetical protein